jgi:beta-galactosidase
VDFVARDADLSGYETVFVPSPALIDEAHAAIWRKYVKAGGNLVVTFRAFFKNQGNTWSDQPTPAGGLSELLGLTVDESISIPPIPAVGLRTPGEPSADWDDDRGSHVADLEAKLPGIGFGEGFGVPPKVRYHVWAEVLKPTTAAPLMRYVDGYYKDGLAAAVNKVGKGAAYTIGCWCDPAIPRSIWHALGLHQRALTDRDIPRTATIEVAKMQTDSGKPVEIRLNHGKRTVTLPEE